MRRGILLGGVATLAAFGLLAQRERPWSGPAYEIKSVLPRETAPAQYQQVDQRELESLAEQGWELVAAVPYIYKNEERGTPAMSPRTMVTQTYPAYFFKRPKPVR